MKPADWIHRRRRKKLRISDEAINGTNKNMIFVRKFGNIIDEESRSWWNNKQTEKCVENIYIIQTRLNVIFQLFLWFDFSSFFPSLFSFFYPENRTKRANLNSLFKRWCHPSLGSSIDFVCRRFIFESFSPSIRCCFPQHLARFSLLASDLNVFFLI